MKKSNVALSILLCILSIGVCAELVRVPLLTQQQGEGLAEVNATLGFEIDSLHPSFINFSDYYDLGNQSIFIKDDDPDYNWSKTAAENPWCSGSGTENDPYVIEKVFIDGEYSLERVGYLDTYYNDESAINIHSTRVPFEIRDCFITRSGKEEMETGILIHDSSYGLIHNNQISYCKQGIYLEWGGGGTANITIKQNIFIHDVIKVFGTYSGCGAIHIYHAQDILVEQNFIQDYIHGIKTSHSQDVMVTKNFVNLTFFGEDTKSGLEFRDVVSCSAISNVLAGDFATEFFTVNTENCTGMSIHDNSVVGTLPAFVTSLIPHLSSTSDSFSFENAIGGSIAYNMMYIPGHVAIPGYDIPLLVMSFVGMICVVALLLRDKMRVKK